MEEDTNGRTRRRKDKGPSSRTTEEGTSKWRKALDPATPWDEHKAHPSPPSPPTCTELHEVVYWLRQVLALLCGVVWGVLPLTGYVGNLAYLGLSGLVLFVFFAKYHRTVDPELYWPLTQEGYLPAYALFLVVWIITYNTAHTP